MSLYFIQGLFRPIDGRLDEVSPVPHITEMIYWVWQSISYIYDPKTQHTVLTNIYYNESSMNKGVISSPQRTT